MTRQSDQTRWNFVVNVFDGAFFAFGMSLVSQQTVLPVFVKSIGGGNVAVGLIPVLWTFGFNAPQIVAARRAQLLSRRKPLLLYTAMWQRLPWLLLAIVTFVFFGRISTDAALWLFFILFGLTALGGSVNLPVWLDLIVKVTPTTQRGRLFGIRSVLGAVLGILGGGIATYVLGHWEYPSSYALLSLLAFLGMMVSYIFVAALRETEESIPAPLSDGMFRSTYRLVRTDKNFRHFLVADALQMCSTAGSAFFAVHAIRKFSLSDASAGTFTMVMMSSMIIGSLGFGMLADRRGHKINLVVSSLATAIACCLAIVAGTVIVYELVFACAALTVALGTISRLPFMAELVPSAQRPVFVAMGNMITAPCVLSGIFAGWIADAVGYEVVFAGAALCALTAAVLLATTVREPRHAHSFH